MLWGAPRGAVCTRGVMWLWWEWGVSEAAAVKSQKLTQLNHWSLQIWGSESVKITKLIFFCFFNEVDYFELTLNQWNWPSWRSDVDSVEQIRLSPCRWPQLSWADFSLHWSLTRWICLGKIDSVDVIKLICLSHWNWLKRFDWFGTDSVIML